MTKTPDEIARELMGEAIPIAAGSDHAADLYPRLFKAIIAAIAAEREAREKAEAERDEWKALKERESQSVLAAYRLKATAEAARDEIDRENARIALEIGTAILKASETAREAALREAAAVAKKTGHPVWGAATAEAILSLIPAKEPTDGR